MEGGSGGEGRVGGIRDGEVQAARDREVEEGVDGARQVPVPVLTVPTGGGIVLAKDENAKVVHEVGILQASTHLSSVGIDLIRRQTQK